MCTLENCNFHLQLAVIWTSIEMIVTIPSKLRFVEMGLFDYGKGVKCKIANCSSSSSSSG